MIDAEGLQIIALRNGGLGAAKKALSPEDKQLLAQMQTNRQGRAVLGAVAKSLQQLYALTDNADLAWGAGSYREAARSTLNSTNNYAQKAYATIPDDDAPLSPLNRRRIEETVRETRNSMTSIPADIDDLNRGLTGMIADALKSMLPKWAQPSGKTADKIVLAVGIGLGVLALIFAVRMVTKIAFGGAALAEAEDEAVRIADALRRKRHSRTAFSVS